MRDGGLRLLSLTTQYTNATITKLDWTNNFEKQKG